MREIERHFPVFLELVKKLQIVHPEWRFETSASSEKLANVMRNMARKAGVPAELINISPGSYHGLMDRAEAALVTSGTATLEAALHEMPFAADGIMTYELIIERINSELANILGNLVNRTIAMNNKYFDGVVQAPTAAEELDEELKAVALAMPGSYIQTT